MYSFIQDIAVTENSKRNQTSIIARMNVGNSIKFKVGMGGKSKIRENF